jgi:hypothetical protein
MFTLTQPLVTAFMILCTAIIQLVAQVALSRLTDALPRGRGRYIAMSRRLMLTLTAVAILTIGHLCQVTIWAIRYYTWGELGDDFFNSFYFSLASFTTVGASELTLSPEHRVVGAVEAATGMLMFGWSTALLVEVINRADRSQDS